MNTDVSESTDETEIGDLLNSSIEPRESDPQSRV
jgi:hypothetical protein